jgi:hypothetical protein
MATIFICFSWQVLVEVLSKFHDNTFTKSQIILCL